jgi:hypothetical protein
MGAPVSVNEDLGVPFLQENGERPRDKLGSRGREGERGVRLEAEGLEKRPSLTMDATERLENKGYKPTLVFGSKLVVVIVLHLCTVTSGLARSAVEVGGGRGVDDRDVNEGEVVRKVELEVRAIARETKVWGLQKAGNPQIVSSRREVGSDKFVASGNGERSEELAGEKVGRVSSKPVATGAGGRKVVVRGKTKTQA